MMERDSVRPPEKTRSHPLNKLNGRGVDDHHRVDQDRQIHWVSAAIPVPQAVVRVRRVTIRTASEVRAQKRKKLVD